MKKNTIVGTVEKVTLGEMTFCEDIMEVWIGINEVSENLKSKVTDAVREAKAESNEHMNKVFGRDWMEETATELSLHVVANSKDKTIKTTVNVFFEELVEDGEFGSGNFEIDLSGYENELKKIIIRGMIDKFF